MPHDPLTALAEADATGATASVFADIRATMWIPLVTSIWRVLAGREEVLKAVWAAARPLYASGAPAAALARMRGQVQFPVPEPRAPGLLEVAGVSPADRPLIRAIIAAYNRSNGMNLIALTVLVAEPAGALPDGPPPPDPAPWPALPPVPAPAEMPAAVWTLVQRINRFGASPDEPGVATLWRHLAHWPELLDAVHTTLAPLQHDGSIDRAIRDVLAFAAREGAALARLRPEHAALPETARTTIARYVHHPGLVARMVAIGHGLETWIHECAGDEYY